MSTGYKNPIPFYGMSIKAHTTKEGYRSMFAFWMGGGSVQSSAPPSTGLNENRGFMVNCGRFMNC